MPELIGFILAVAIQAGIAGAIVGFIWALALSVHIGAGLFWGACISIAVWVAFGLLGTARGRVNYKEAMFALSGIMVWISIAAGVLGLVVWGIRAVL